jgi:hypothetical protein
VRDEPLFIAFLLTWIIYVPVVHLIGARRRTSPAFVALTHALPTVVAIAMASIFLIGDGATVRQCAAGSPSAEKLASLWAGLWPLLLFGAFFSAFSLLIATGAAIQRRLPRSRVAITLPGMAMSAFAFYIVITNFPDA